MWALEELPVSTPCTFHGLGHPATYSPNWDTLGKGSFNNNYTRIIAVNQDSPWTLSRAVKEIMFNLITKPQNHLSFLNKDVLSSFALAEDNQCDISENTGCFEPQQKSFPP